MSKTVTFTSRAAGDPVRMLQVRCEFFQVYVKPAIVERGAGGFVQRSLQPRTMTLVNAEEADLDDLRGIVWTEARWFDQEQGRDVEHAIQPVQIHGRNVRCAF